MEEFQNITKSTRKRRSKTEQSKRAYQCGCGRTYLSYPALYTHIKNKHFGQQPEGTNAPSTNNGRGRGRPKKADFKDDKENLQPPLNPLEAFKVSKDAKTKCILYQKVQEMMTYQQWKPGIYNCNDLLAKYLIDLSKIFNLDYNKKITLFAINLRRFLNLKAWQNNQIDRNKEYCSIYDLTNLLGHEKEFLNNFLPQNCSSLNKDESQTIFQHFCRWVKRNNFQV